MRTIQEISDTMIEKSSKTGKKLIFFIATFIATGCFIGKTKYAPGTFGSLLAIIFCPYFVSLSLTWQILILCLITTCGTLATHLYLIKIDDQLSDPAEVVIDEIVAVLLMSLLTQITLPANELTFQHFLSIFVLFRIFDISKPYPISYVDKNIKGVTGIMLDDIFAGIAGWVIFHCLFKYIY